MSESMWHKQGATLSHKNACIEFGFSESEIFQAMKAGKLQYQQNYAHGNPYYKLLRSEVHALAEEIHGKERLERQELKHKLAIITKEINSLNRKLIALMKQKTELTAKLELQSTSIKTNKVSRDGDTRMKKTKTKPENIQAYCHFCGSTVGQISEGTDEKVHSIYDCPKCRVNYCDQCSYFNKEDQVQRCLRCESKMEKVM